MVQDATFNEENSLFAEIKMKRTPLKGPMAGNVIAFKMDGITHPRKKSILLSIAQLSLLTRSGAHMWSRGIRNELHVKVYPPTPPWDLHKANQPPLVAVDYPETNG